MFSIKNKEWKNWSETVMNQMEYLYYPENIQDVLTIVKECAQTGRSLRAVGAGHSFTPLAATGECLVSLDKLSGIDQIDQEHNLVTVWAGTTLKDLGELLHHAGYAMENLGDINVQTIAGAISTGTHGTGIEFGSISTQITSLTVVTAAGEIIEVSRDSAYFQAMRVSLGMLGIIVKVQLRCIPSHQLVGESFKTTLDTCLDQLEEWKRQNRHFEFYWFPHTKHVQIKCMNSNSGERLPEKKGSYFNKIVVENGLLWGLSEMCRLSPRLSKTISTISAFGVPVGKEAGDSHELYATPRLVKFYEMEYSIPAEHMAAVLRDIQYIIEKNKIRVHFPIECRYVKADNIWLSPAYQRDSAYIAVHMYKGMEFQPYFDAVEKIFQYYDGRPHWGKMHTMDAGKLADVYPEFESFLKVRTELDPDGLFLNGYLRTLFGIHA